MKPSIVCLLHSQLNKVPSIQLSVGDSWLIGRNSHCKIKDLRCSRHQLQVIWRTSDRQELCVQPGKTGKAGLLKESTFKQNALIEGPGFCYQVNFVEQPETLSDSPAHKSSKKRKAVEMEQNDRNGNVAKHVKQEETEKVSSYLVHDELATDGWCSYDNGSLLVFRYKCDQYMVPSKKVIAFDFDGTLVDPKSGGKFARDQNDWKLKSLSLPTTIRRLSEEGALFVIFSNQNGIATGAANEQSIKARFKQVSERLNVPCVACLAVEDDHNRKPRIGMWQFFIQTINRGVQPDLRQCLYVGDALGRKKGGTISATDHSAADLLFAFNAGLPVLSPEQFIAGKTQGKLYTSVKELTAFKLPKFVPTEFLQQKATPATLCSGPTSEKQLKFESYAEMVKHLKNQLANQNEQKGALVVLVGLPASGKSSFYQKYLEDKFFWINRDKLGTIDRCEKALQEQISQAQSQNRPCFVCVDNTNTDTASRKRWIENDSGKKAGLLTVCVEMLINVDHCMHNEAFRRTYKGLGEYPQREQIKPVPTVAMRTSNSRYQAVNGKKEGFDFHYRLEFVPDFDHEEQRKYYAMFLKDK